jgi:aspartate racemase
MIGTVEGDAAMKTIGLLGGMSWESTIPYYRIVNRVVGERLGGLHSAQILLYSVDFQPIEELQHTGRWEEAGEILAGAAGRLESAGADFLVICTNTMHKVAPQIEQAIGIPLLHIADATAEEIERTGLKRIGLLGTRFTMEEEFYRGRLEDRHQLEVIVPNDQDRQMVHRVTSIPDLAATMRRSSGVWPTREPRASFWAVPRSPCWSHPRTPRCPFSTPRRYTPGGRRSGRCRRA